MNYTIKVGFEQNFTNTYILNNLSNSKNNYDCFDDIGFYTNGFTERMDEIKILDFDHTFFTYLKALINLEEIKDKLHHSYYHIETKNMKMIVRPNIDRKILNVIHNAWQQYFDIDCDVNIYSTYCNSLYIIDDYETDKVYYYKYIAKRYMDMI
jgi:hypothetical protein